MTLRSRLPSSGALYMFEAAARHASFTRAAGEFNVTQPAVSRTIGALESHLGYRLFDRHVTGLILTEEGRRLDQAVRAGFGEIERVLEDLERLRADPDEVTLSVTSAFALHWLMPRMSRLKEDLPGVSLRFDLIHGEPCGPLGRADLAIRHAWTPEPGQTVLPILQERIIPVCSPGYLARRGLIEDAPDGAGHVLAVLTGKMRVPWDAFLQRAGLPGMPQAKRIEFSDYALLIQAAITGQCVGLGWWHVAGGEIERGGLVPASRHVLTGTDQYHLVARGEPQDLREAVRRVMDWLAGEVAAMPEPV
ncbi:MAG: LysR family transcriptional regulator [Rhodobacteraceae bacterium]|nr:LysR family transcriptional regulator [Paracoccaceae bacterium]